jgi:hypothetical protein
MMYILRREYSLKKSNLKHYELYYDEIPILLKKSCCPE